VHVPSFIDCKILKISLKGLNTRMYAMNTFLGDVAIKEDFVEVFEAFSQLEVS